MVEQVPLKEPARKALAMGLEAGKEFVSFLRLDILLFGRELFTDTGVSLLGELKVTASESRK